MPNPIQHRRLSSTKGFHSSSRRTILQSGAAALSIAAVQGNAISAGLFEESKSMKGLSYDEIDKPLEELRSKHGLPGLMAGYFQKDGTTKIAACGKRKMGDTQPLVRNDLMHLGSCTKSMTATLVAMFVEEGKLDWDTTLSKSLAGISAYANSPWGKLTVSQLMEHVSGTPANAPWAMWLDHPDLVLAREEIAKWLLVQPYPESKSIEKTSAQNESHPFLYSNVGYMLLGHILERIDGNSWEEIIRRRLFAPLEMHSAGFGSPVQRKDFDSSWGHFRDKDSDPWRPIDSDNPAALGPAGTVHASLEDWAKYLRVCLHESPEDGFPLPIGAENWSRLRNAKISESYAGGWITGSRGWAGGKILTHNGCNTMWYCVTFLAPEKEIGVFAASNCGLYAAKAADEALQLVIQMEQLN